MVSLWISSIFVMKNVFKRFDRVKAKNEEERIRDEKFHCFVQRPLKYIDNRLVKTVMYIIAAPVLMARIIMLILSIFLPAATMFTISQILPYA